MTQCERIIAAAAAVFLLYMPAASAEETGLQKLAVKTKEWKEEQVYLQNGRVYSAPSALARGGQWEIQETDGIPYAVVSAGRDGAKKAVRLPVEENGMVDLTFYAESAGIRYKLNEKKKEIKFEKPKKEKRKVSKDKKPVLVMWDPDNSFDGEKPFFSGKKGTRVVSPVWGTYEELRSGRRYFPLDYIRGAGKAGVAVVPLVSNDFDPEATSALLADTEKREDVLRALTAYAAVYGLKGWNVDFENMRPSDKDAFTAFVKDLAERLHDEGKSLSVDITVIGDEDSYWTGCYDRGALARYADYEILMGYDQTAGGSSHAGPVSAYDWLDRSLPPLLKEVPADKLVLGLPFYTRVWTGDDGSVSSDVLTLQYTDDFGQRHKFKPLWQKKEKQFYADWRENGVRRRVWLEESRSLAEKLKLLDEYDLAGAAFWRYGFENESVYAALEQAL